MAPAKVEKYPRAEGAFNCEDTSKPCHQLLDGRGTVAHGIARHRLRDASMASLQSGRMPLGRLRADLARKWAGRQAAKVCYRLWSHRVNAAPLNGTRFTGHRARPRPSKLARAVLSKGCVDRLKSKPRADLPATKSKAPLRGPVSHGDASDSGVLEPGAGVHSRRGPGQSNPDGLTPYGCCPSVFL